MSLARYSFTVETVPIGFVAYLGDYDLEAPVAHGRSPAEAIAVWCEMWGETLPEGGAA